MTVFILQFLSDYGSSNLNAMFRTEAAAKAAFAIVNTTKDQVQITDDFGVMFRIDPTRYSLILTDTNKSAALASALGSANQEAARLYGLAAPVKASTH